jgi:hypothetical protein
VGLQPLSAGWVNFSVTPFLDPDEPNNLLQSIGVRIYTSATVLHRY